MGVCAFVNLRGVAFLSCASPIFCMGLTQVPGATSPPESGYWNGSGWTNAGQPPPPTGSRLSDLTALACPEVALCYWR